MNNCFKESDVQLYLKMLQDIISRMAGNSNQCKKWLLAILTAVITYTLSQRYQNDVLCYKVICYTLICLFSLLDSYYLGLERYFRYVENEFVLSVHKEDYYDKLFRYNIDVDSSKCEKFCNKILYTLKALFSFAVLPFYLVLIILVRFI